MNKELKEYADGLIELGRFILEHEELFRDDPSDWALKNRPDAVGEICTPDPVAINLQAKNAESLAAKVRLLGRGEKYNDANEYFATTGVRREFGPHVVDVFVQSGAVCTPKRTEPRTTKRVELTDEAKAEIEAIRARHTVMETTNVVVEWSCPPSLLSPSREDDTYSTTTTTTKETA